MTRIGWPVGAWSRRSVARALVARTLDLHVVGLEHVPAHGACILVARHYHHLYDAAVILATIPRDVHILVALDWLGGGIRLRLMRWLVVAARWPGVWRLGHASRINRDGYRLSLSLLREGRLLLVFPEGYPTIDPQGSRKPDRNAWLPFDPGFVTLAEHAGVPVSIVPVGMVYAERPGGGWTVWLRIGEAVHFGASAPGERRVRRDSIEVKVRNLSLPPVVRA